jgi:hypothetical protein
VAADARKKTSAENAQHWTGSKTNRSIKAAGTGRYCALNPHEKGKKWNQIMAV